MRKQNSMSSDTALLEPITESPAPVARPRRRRTWPRSQKWMRILHVYSSMIALLVVLFFGVTGITLNHPDWTFGFDPVTTTAEGTLPDGWLAADGQPEYLVISEFLRSAQGVGGEVVGFGADATTGYIEYKGPGYGAAAYFDLGDGSYDLVIEQQGWIGILNDLHKGRDTNTGWKWVIDVSGVALVAIAATGLVLQLVLHKRRRAALLTVLGGSVITVVFVALTLA